MKITYEKKTKSAYVYVMEKIKPGKVKATKKVAPGVYVDYDGKGNMLGIEILGCDIKETK